MSPDEQFIQPFVESAENVFSTMLGMAPTWSRTYQKTDNSAFAEISAVMGTSEGGAEGLMTVSLPVAIAKKVGGGFLGMEVTELTDDVKECIGELLNMIAGGAKAKLEGTAFFFKLSIPTVILGQHMEIHHKPDRPCVVAEMVVDGEAFVIEVSMKRA